VTETLHSVLREEERDHSRVARGASRAGIWAIHLYQTMRAGRPSPCRYFPSCSEYAVESLELHGFVRGTWLAIRRVSRCRPFGGFGADPVPN